VVENNRSFFMIQHALSLVGAVLGTLKATIMAIAAHRFHRKTTTMLFKMLNVERSGPMISNRKLRQVFITQSRVLAERVEEYYVKLVQSSAAGECSGMDTIHRAVQCAQTEKGIMELDDEDDIRSGLPKKFSQLTDEHFPLFLTFDKVHYLGPVSYLFLNHSPALSAT
jgi:hypothetical protein